jgi:hypothetical protein
MVDYDKLYYTNIYNWTILGDKEVDCCYVIYCKTYGDWATISFYIDKNRINLNGTMIYCDSFEKANKFVTDLLKVNRWEINERYLGRYFKIKKLIYGKI